MPASADRTERLPAGGSRSPQPARTAPHDLLPARAPPRPPPRLDLAYRRRHALDLGHGRLDRDGLAATGKGERLPLPLSPDGSRPLLVLPLLRPPPRPAP